jgi:hypothetical protein
MTQTAPHLARLCGVSLASSERVLPTGGWKYFCEIDCRIGYSVSGVETTDAIVSGMRQTSARGQFVAVRRKVWFDEHAISPYCGEAPRTPNPRPRRARRPKRPRVRAGPSWSVGRAQAGSLGQPLRTGQSF